MTKIPSVEEKVEAFTKTIKGEFPCQMIGGVAHYDILLLKEELKASLTADRTALLTELRESKLLEEKEHKKGNDDCSWCEIYGHNTLARAIKAHIDNLINPPSV